jgi:translation initiation factor IF-3
LLKTRFNHQIQAPQVRLISDTGEQIGIMPTSQALALAQEHGLDLVEISPNAQPPVAKLISYDKFRYQQKKLEQQQRKNAKRIEVKTMRLSSRISTHDMQIKAKQADGFLSEGNLVRIELRMRGREQAYGNLAEQQIKTFQGLLTFSHKVEVPLKRMGNTISLTLSPSK